ncbi:hypothetical protein [Pseudonocardia sp. MH-G8]|uniref:hypothetical protein n=1 Tax=Pseudonocardia sp. MH-G8 TaxID=1854588 RepID=UPI00117A3BAE|nr:hypothetical protein [Pseudonocardia sp. MH-G8]
MLVGLPAVSYAQAPPPVSIQGEVMKTWEDGRGNDVVLRRGYWSAGKPRAGFGYEKILNKHGITDLGVVESIVRRPDSVESQVNGRIAHTSAARQFKCYITGCTVVQSVPVIVIIDYGEWAGPGQFGVVTAYCDNADGSWRCPDFVNAAIKP